ncbi:c6 zinc finger protein domain protein [Teratosphaeria destructans]|uniref:C6 zinc finger protein domain protein n=1 Tax=Teratosphaeria destructans TaxID=418781 RepID=A0A9W7SQ80_9PEZI|nr:c6 zinc finger protein domain protein [Teratosphaeria destructans]
MAPKQQAIHRGDRTMTTFWDATVDLSRTPSPTPRPPKRTKPSPEKCSGNGRVSLATPRRSDVEVDDVGFHETLNDGRLRHDLGNHDGGDARADSVGLALHRPDLPAMIPSVSSPAQALMASDETLRIKGKPCDARDPRCKLAVSDDWNLNHERGGEDEEALDAHPTPEVLALSAYRPDIKWRRSWRERHSLNFFVNFSAPQMAGFFDSTFWQRMVIQMSYHQPAILHAITAIGALHEAIMQRAFADDKRKAQAMEFALNQCNRAIASFTASHKRGRRGGVKSPDSRLALTTCVLFTCFEAMQGRCDSAVNHALQGRRLLEATRPTNVTTTSSPRDDDLEHMRPLVERLEVQATALLDKGRRPHVAPSDRTAPLPHIKYVYSLDHAHNTLHTALNSVMRFMQGCHPAASRDHVAVAMAEKYLRYAPWFTSWERAFTNFLSERRDVMNNLDLKRAMVLKANHLVGTMLASVDQSAGPAAYDAYEAEFKAIVDLSREVLASFSCPPLPTLTGGTSGTPYLSFSLWVTDPLWMAISRCRNPGIRQTAFTLLSQNPRQEGIWHAGPSLAHNKPRKAETAPKRDTTKIEKSAGGSPAGKQQSGNWTRSGDPDMSDDDDESDDEEPPEKARKADALAHTKQSGACVNPRANHDGMRCSQAGAKG